MDTRHMVAGGRLVDAPENVRVKASVTWREGLVSGCEPPAPYYVVVEDGYFGVVA